MSSRWFYKGVGWFLCGLSAFAQAQTPRLMYPRDGDEKVDLKQDFKWAAVEGADAYYLKIGTQPWASDLVDTGEIQQTYFTVVPDVLPDSQDLWASLHARKNGNWFSSQIRFRVPPTLLYPRDASVNNMWIVPFRWFPTANNTYRIEVGARMGEFNLWDSGEMQGVSTLTIPLELPGSTRLWARLSSTAPDGSVRTSISSFELALRFHYPVHGSTTMQTGETFRWTPIVGVDRYIFSLGTTPDGTDLIYRDDLTQPELNLTEKLPKHKPLYARVTAHFPDGTSRRTDSVFEMKDSRLPRAELLEPRPGHRLASGHPFRWRAIDLATGYRLEIRRGHETVHDSGWMLTTSRFVSGLSRGHYLAKVSYRINTQEFSSQFPFEMGDWTPDPDVQQDALFKLTRDVHEMAAANDPRNYPRRWSALYRYISGHSYDVNCRQYADTLVELIGQANLAAHSPSQLQIGFILNGYDGHTLVQTKRIDDGRPVLLDPTFALTFKNRGGSWASVQDVQTSVRDRRWDDIRYVALSPNSDWMVHNYYLDLPLLFLNVAPLSAIGLDPRPYLRQENDLPAGDTGAYVFGGAPGGVVKLWVDGEARLLPLDKRGLSKVIYASTIKAADETHQPEETYSVPRYVFTR